MANDKDRESIVRDEDGNPTHIRVVSEDGESSQLFKWDNSFAANICNEHRGERVEIAIHDGEETTAYEPDNSLWSMVKESNFGILGTAKEKGSEPPPAPEAPRRSDPEPSSSSSDDDDYTPSYDYTPSSPSYTPSSFSPSSYSRSRSSPSSGGSNPLLKVAWVGLGLLLLGLAGRNPPQEQQPEQAYEQQAEPEQSTERAVIRNPLEYLAEEREREEQKARDQKSLEDRLNSASEGKKEVIYLNINQRTRDAILAYGGAEISAKNLLDYCPQIRNAVSGKKIMVKTLADNSGQTTTCTDWVIDLAPGANSQRAQPAPVQAAPEDNSISYYFLKINQRTFMRMDQNGDQMVSSDEVRDYCDQARQEVAPNSYISMESVQGYEDTTDSCRKLMANADIIKQMPYQRPGSFFNLRINLETMKRMDINRDQRVSLEEVIHYCPPLQEKNPNGVNVNYNFEQNNWGPIQTCKQLIDNAWVSD